MKQKNPRQVGRPEKPQATDRQGSRSAGPSGPDDAGVASEARRHTVVSGDSLSAIARRYYGSDRREDWMRIYETNRAIIGPDPDRLRPGQQLIIPAND